MVRRSADYYISNTMLEAPAIGVYCLGVELIECGRLDLSKEDLIKQVLNCFEFNFNQVDDEGHPFDISTTGYFFPAVYDDPAKFFVKCNYTDKLKELMNLGKTVFIATNSNYYYGKFVLEYILGENYADYFNFICYFAAKPAFFYDKNRVGYLINEGELKKNVFDGTNELKERGNEILEGNIGLIMQKGSLAYMGDHLFSDCYYLKDFPECYTIFVDNFIDSGNEHLKHKYIGKVWGNYHKVEGIDTLTMSLLREKTNFITPNAEYFFKKHVI